VESGSIAVTIGSLDDPTAARPVEQFGIESELSWTSGLRALPAKRTEDWMREYGIAHSGKRRVLLGEHPPQRAGIAAKLGSIQRHEQHDI